jgi:hypothetical protein
MLLTNRVVVPMLVAILLPLAVVGQKEEQHCSDYLYGLYYGSWDNRGSDLAFVISPDGKPIPPKANDPEAPTQPGFYVGEQRFKFASSRFSPQGFSLRTNSVNGTMFSFHGRFGCEQVDEIPEVPYLEGELKETRNGRVVRIQKVHFRHAVVL